MERLTSKVKRLVIGANPVGREVATQLAARGARVLLVDKDAEKVAAVDIGDCETTVADFTDDDALVGLGVGSDAATLFALLPEDAANVFLVISARNLAPDLPIVALAESPDSAQRLRAAGATKVIDPYEISGRKIHQLIRRPVLTEILETTLFGRANLHIAEIEIPVGCFLAGSRLDRLRLQRDYDVVILGMVDRARGDALIFATRGETHYLDSGDVLVAIGPKEELERLRQGLSA